MTAIYLWINAVLYSAFSVICAVNVAGTASSLGYKSLSTSGQSEYLTVYGGLQLGLAVFFGMVAYRPEWNRVGLLMALCLYSAIVVFRLGSLAKYWPVEKMTSGVAALEFALLLGAAWLWFSDKVSLR